MTPTLPDRVTVPTCIACGAMGRDERCEADCSEHRLPLVGAADFEALRVAGRAARTERELLGPVVRRLGNEPETELGCLQAYEALREAARAALARVGHRDRDRDWAAPATALGWWCAECGNVDAPQPCLGVCVWHRIEWVNGDLYDAEFERLREDLGAARELRLVVARIAALSPKRGQCVRTWRALQSQAQLSAGR